MWFNSLLRNFSHFQPKQPSFFSLREYFAKKTFYSKLTLVFIATFVLYYAAYLYMYLFAIPLKLGITNEDFDFFIKYIALDNNIETLTKYPWQILTYTLVSVNLWQLLFNLIFLGLFSKIFYEFWNNTIYIILILVAILTTGLIFVFGNDIFHFIENLNQNYLLYGVNPIIYALIGYMLATLYNYKISIFLFFKVKLKYLFLTYIVFDILILSKAQPLKILALLITLAVAFVIGIIIKNFPKNIVLKKPKFKVTYNKNYQNQQKNDPDEIYFQNRKEKQDKLDKILEKISKDGYSTLTKEEKDFLFIESKK